MKPEFLLGRVAEHGYRLDVVNGVPQLTPTRPDCRMPQPLLAALKQNRDAVIGFLASCPLCGRDCSDAEDRERLADPLYCQFFGSPWVRDGNGNVHEAQPRCPHKPPKPSR